MALSLPYTLSLRVGASSIERSGVKLPTSLKVDTCVAPDFNTQLRVQHPGCCDDGHAIDIHSLSADVRTFPGSSISSFRAEQLVFHYVEVFCSLLIGYSAAYGAAQPP